MGAYADGHGKRSVRCGRRFPALGRAILICLSAGAGLLVAGSAAADAGASREPVNASYLATKAVNVRAKPSTASRKLGKLGVGARVVVVGKAGRGWLAVKRDDGTTGFVYGSYLIPLIDGSLERQITGEASAVGGTRCAYTIAFWGKSPVPNEVFETSDYEIAWRCDYGGEDLRFRAFMFITEAPYALSVNPVYQIGVDVREVVDSLDESLSTVVMYEAAKSRVVLDRVSPKGFRAGSAETERPAGDVPEALAGAADLVLGSWNAKVWRALGGAGH